MYKCIFNTATPFHIWYSISERRTKKNTFSSYLSTLTLSFFTLGDVTSLCRSPVPLVNAQRSCLFKLCSLQPTVPGVTLMPGTVNTQWSVGCLLFYMSPRKDFWQAGLFTLLHCFFQKKMWLDKILISTFILNIQQQITCSYNCDFYNGILRSRYVCNAVVNSTGINDTGMTPRKKILFFLSFTRLPVWLYLRLCVGVLVRTQCVCVCVYVCVRVCVRSAFLCVRVCTSVWVNMCASVHAC